MCTIKPVPFRGVNCSDAAGHQVNYNHIIQMVKNSSTGSLFDAETQSPYFNYVVWFPALVFFQPEFINTFLTFGRSDKSQQYMYSIN